MSNTTLVRKLETDVRWRYNQPAVVLTAGLRNDITFDFKDTPDDASPAVIEAVTASAALRRVGQEDFVVAYTSEVAIPSGSTSITIDMRLPADITLGCYWWYVTLKDGAGEIVDFYKCAAIINQSVTPTNQEHLSLEDIRQELDDITAEDNRLDESLEYSTGDIVNAMIRTIREWNDTPPRVGKYYGDNFPYPMILKQGVISAMLTSMCMFLERRRLQYQGGGTSVDIERRVDYYKQKADFYMTDWRRQMAIKKREDDMAMFRGDLFTI